MTRAQMLAVLTGELLAAERPSPVLPARTVLELTVGELVAAGATVHDLEVMGARPERTTVRVLWAIDGANLATRIPAFCRKAQDAGIFPRVVGRRGEPLPEGPGGAFAHAVLRGADLRGDYRGGDFSGADLRRADMRGGSFQGACFVGARLAGANLVGACFEDCDAEQADFAGVEVKADELASEWARAELSGATWSLAAPVPRGWTAHNIGHGRGVLLRTAEEPSETVFAQQLGRALDGLEAERNGGAS